MLPRLGIVAAIDFLLEILATWWVRPNAGAATVVLMLIVLAIATVVQAAFITLWRAVSRMPKSKLESVAPTAKATTTTRSNDPAAKGSGS